MGWIRAIFCNLFSFIVLSPILLAQVDVLLTFALALHQHLDWWNEARECTEIIIIQFHPPG